MIRRIFVEKKKGFDVEAKNLKNDLEESLNIKVKSLRVLNRYDIEGIDEKDFLVSKSIFAEPNIDNIYDDIKIDSGYMFGIEYLDGQYDQRADFASQCVEILISKRPIIKTAKIYIIDGDFDIEKVKKFMINPVDSKEANLEIPDTLKINTKSVKKDYTLHNFIELDEKGLRDFHKENNLAMTYFDLEHIKNYFKNDEKRNPTITEIKVLDTYWSDHCRHTTFMTKIENISIENGKYNEVIKKSYKEYLDTRNKINSKKDITLMDIATIAMKKLRLENKLEDLDLSEEINACSINVDVEIDGKIEKYLVMFKNETHNHPTEIEPFGGAGTCLGGAIRDPLSGRSYVYQAMRVTGSANPLTKYEDTLEGKLTQKKITTTAAYGYSSYGNQIGLATGQVSEVYHPDFVAKRMEIGAVIAATPKENVIREVPKVGDVVLLVGGKTGRDGCGGATGSSKEHTEESILTCSAEVQKGDAPTERKIQRFFRNEKVAKMIKKCNDFGAGGVCVAIGELCDSLDIFLDLVPKKYDGLDGTEIAISESQERMAVVIDKENLDEFIRLSNEENLMSTMVAKVTDTNYVRMFFEGETILNLKRDFIETNGVTQKTDVLVKKIDGKSIFDMRLFDETDKTNYEKVKKVMSNLNICSQKGLVEMFDSSIGANTVLMPFGGKYQATPSLGMVCKIPVYQKEINISTIMTYGYNPYIAKWSPFHGAYYALIESIVKVVCIGGKYENIRLTLQEYFEKLGQDFSKWGKPFSALLGAFHVQNNMDIPAIGGKDSMSGTFKDISVPPTLVSFAVNTVDCEDVVSNEFKKANSKVVLLKTTRLDDDTLDFESLKNNLAKVNELILNKKVLSSYSVGFGGICEAICKMSFGNKIGFRLENDIDIYEMGYGNIILEVESLESLKDTQYILLGETSKEYVLDIFGEKIDLEKVYASFSNVLESVFKTKTNVENSSIETVSFNVSNESKSSIKIAKPNVFIPTFPGTNCEYDLERAFLKAGAKTEIQIFKNLNQTDIKDSINNIVNSIKTSQIIMFPGGFSAGDEPDGSGKFIATVFRNEYIKEAIDEFLERDGLILGICNGFQALVKLGLLPYGKIMETKEDSPTLTYNDIGRHQSKVVSTRISSNKSPWLYETNVGDIHKIAISHGEGKFVCSEEIMKELIKNGQIATQYVDLDNKATYDIEFNPNGSYYAVEGITSIDGRIFGKMGHSERIGNCVMKNVIGEKDQKIFESGVKYFL